MADTPTGAGSNGGTTTVVSNPPNPPTINTVPNTTTDTTTVDYQSSVSESVFDPRQDPTENVFDPGATYNGPAAEESVFDPRQDVGEHVFDPGATYNGPAAEESVFDPRQDVGENVFDPGALAPPAGDWYDSAVPSNDPYIGLTQKQVQALGGADPTDPYIRARLGIPQLAGSILNITAGFGTIKTGVPKIDTALGIIGGISTFFNGINNLANAIGGLFGGKPTASATAATTGSGVAGAAAPTPTPPTKDAPVNPASDPSQFPAYDDDGNLQPGFKINEETGQPYYTGDGPGVQTTTTTLSDEESAALFADAGTPGDGPGVQTTTTTLSDEESAALFEGTDTPTAAQQAATNAETAADASALYPGTNNTNLKNINESQAAIDQNTAGIANAESIIEQNNRELADPNISPERRAELEANNAAQYEYIDLANENTAYNENAIVANADAFAAGGGDPESGQNPDEVSAAEDPAAAAAESVFDPGQTFNAGEESVFDPEAVDPEEDPEAQFPPDDEEVDAFDAEDVDPEEGGLELPPGAEEDDPPQEEPYALNPDEDEAIAQQEGGGDEVPADTVNPDAEDAASEAAVREQAKQQATYKARYGDIQRTPDWRVRLSLAPGAQYLYNDPSADVLKPLSSGSGTNGVIFPYTPQISTTYSANYEQYDLTHSNYRGIFYKNSRVGDISIRGTFTAQDTTEANYLLAVIHFFRSVTKMFYGQDAQRGAPPPICYLNGFGQYQFSNHPVVVSAFNYSLPNDVDYIRTTSPNNFGLNLLDRYNQTPAPSRAGSGPLAGLNRLKNAVSSIGGLPKGAENPQRGPYNAVPGMVNNQTPSTYVPTKMEIDLTLIPVQTRSQVSQQFSLQGFANGDLLRGGFW